MFSLFIAFRLIDAYGCLGVLNVNGGSTAESNLFLVMITGASNVGKVLDVEVPKNKVRSANSFVFSN